MSENPENQVETTINDNTKEELMSDSLEKPGNQVKTINNNNNNNNPVKEEQVNKKEKFKEHAPYGNYRNYYGYRVPKDVEQDPRFTVLKKEWLEGKDCLDIGCNSGLVTMNIAKKFRCRTILGVDIDNARINAAWSNLKNFAGLKRHKNDRYMAPKSKIVTDVNEAGCGESCSASLREVNSGDSSVEPKLLDIVSFRCGNFVSRLCELPLENYDTVICLSVTKWVHLNWGDDGLVSLFTKIWRLLNPGGILILEPQPWKSYYNNRLTTETTNRNYHNILIKPKDFQDILLDKVGFRTVEQATSRVSGATAGFDRPVLVFRK